MNSDTDVLRDDGDESSSDFEFSRALDELHASTRELMRSETVEEIAEIAVDAAYRILGFPGTGIRMYDERTEALVSVSFDGESTDRIDSRPDFDVRSSPHGEAFRTQETVVYEVPEDDPYGLDAFERTMYVPLGDHGVLSLGRTDCEEFDRTDAQCAEILAANTRVALDRIQREAQLRERKHELERKNERLEQFASVVSHDMRNPINAAQGYLEFAERERDPEYFGKVDDALTRLERLTTELLTLAQDGATVGELEPTDLSEVSRSAWTAVDTDSATLTIRESPTVVADPVSLQRLLENLFKNAVIHAGPDVTVTVGVFPDGSASASGASADSSVSAPSERSEDEARGEAKRTASGFYVEDDGPGIPEDERASVFEQGYTTDSRGTGLGLAIVENLAQAHGWTIELDESEAGGARFEVTDVER